MLEKDALKAQGLTFGRALLRGFKVAQMYTPFHPAAQPPLEQAYSSLNSLLMQTKKFTFGFVNHRILLNTVLTTDKSLEALEAEFSRRNIGGISFWAGITFEDFKKGIGILITKPDNIEKSGGIKSFLTANLVDGMNFHDSESRKDSTDDELAGMDPSAYFTAQAIMDLDSRAGSSSLQSLIQMAEMTPGASDINEPGKILQIAENATIAALEHPESDPKVSSPD